MSEHPHRYRYVRCATGTVQWCKRCGHVPLKNQASRKISEKGCWSWENKNFRIERGYEADLDGPQIFGSKV